MSEDLAYILSYLQEIWLVSVSPKLTVAAMYIKEKEKSCLLIACYIEVTLT